MKNKWISLFLVLAFLLAFSGTVAAEEWDPSRAGTISVTLVSKDGETPMEGAELLVYHVATVTCDPEGKLFYAYTHAFADCGISLDDPDLAAKLDAFVAENSVDCRKALTDAHGKAAWEDLPLGLYFVKQSGTVEGFAPCASFLVTVPLETEDGYQYQVDAAPKTDVARYIDLTIRKVWNTDENDRIPNQVTVQLLRGETVVDTVVLNAENGWEKTLTDLPESDQYDILELDVPQGYTATYSQNGYLFTVANTPSLAQTGQIVWPIPVLTMAGMGLLMAGFVLLRKMENENA